MTKTPTSKRRRMQSLPASTPVAPPSGGATVVPDQYRQDAIDYLIDCVTEGQTLREACRDELMPSMQIVRGWLRNDDGFKKRYLDAMRVKTLLEADNIISIADGMDQHRVIYTDEVVDELTGETVTRHTYNEPDTTRDRLRVDTRFKLLAKLEPTVFGDKVEHDHTVTGELANMLHAAMNKGHGLPGGR